MYGRLVYCWKMSTILPESKPRTHLVRDASSLAKKNGQRKSLISNAFLAVSSLSSFGRRWLAIFMVRKTETASDGPTLVLSSETFSKGFIYLFSWSLCLFLLLLFSQLTTTTTLTSYSTVTESVTSAGRSVTKTAISAIYWSPSPVRKAAPCCDRIDRGRWI